MKSLKTIIGIVSVVVVLPIWYYLLYAILVRVNASEVMWLLYWIYLPVGLLMGFLNKIVELNEKP